MKTSESLRSSSLFQVMFLKNFVAVFEVPLYIVQSAVNTRKEKWKDMRFHETLYRISNTDLSFMSKVIKMQGCIVVHQTLSLDFDLDIKVVL